MSSFFTVYDYSAENLAQAMSNDLTSIEDVKAHNHYLFFCEYFGTQNEGLAAKTIVVEHQYISRSYLNDYANFYSISFGNYGRFCKRLHFFNRAILQEHFLEQILDTSMDLNESYLGYIVIKPLPKANIGATLVKTYTDNIDAKRIFPCSRLYEINLYGRKLTLHSLAFQEQDSVVGSCAASALWSAFHKTADLFHTAIPSPSQITKSARNLYNNSGRMFPNAVLGPFQIGSAIEAVGLEFELRNNIQVLKDAEKTKALIYSYIKMGLPVLLGIKMLETDEQQVGHLILITGYKESKQPKFARKKTISLKAHKIERFYAHDDQVGPFCRIGFNEDGTLETSWRNKTTGKKNQAAVQTLIIPVHHKIRLTYEDIYSRVSGIDFYFNLSIKKEELYWDIYLDFSNNYKSALLRQDNVGKAKKTEILTRCLPKYVWVAKGYIREDPLVEFIFDATEIPAAGFCLFLHFYNPGFATFLRTDLQREEIKTYFFEQNPYQGPYYYNLLVLAAAEAVYDSD